MLFVKGSYLLGERQFVFWQVRLLSKQIEEKNLGHSLHIPPLWTDLVKMFSRKPRHVSSFSLEHTDYKNVIFEKIHWAHSEDAKVAEVKRPQNPKRRKF